MGGVEHHLRAEFLHPRDGAHVGDQIVVAKGRSTLGEEIVTATRSLELGGHIFHIPRREELAFFDIHHAPGLGGGHNEVGLAAEKRGDLENIDELGGDHGLLGRVDIRGDWRLDGGTDFGQQGATLSNRGAPEGFRRGAVRLVVGGLENKRRSLAIADFFNPVGHPAREGRRFDDARTENKKKFPAAETMLADFDRATLCHVG